MVHFWFVTRRVDITTTRYPVSEKLSISMIQRYTDQLFTVQLFQISEGWRHGEALQNQTVGWGWILHCTSHNIQVSGSRPSKCSPHLTPRLLPFRTLQELVEHYSKDSDGLCVNLCKPCVQVIQKFHDLCSRIGVALQLSVLLLCNFILRFYFLRSILDRSSIDSIP